MLSQCKMSFLKQEIARIIKKMGAGWKTDVAKPNYHKLKSSVYS